MKVRSRGFTYVAGRSKHFPPLVFPFFPPSRCPHSLRVVSIPPLPTTHAHDDAKLANRTRLKVGLLLPQKIHHRFFARKRGVGFIPQPIYSFFFLFETAQNPDSSSPKPNLNAKIMVSVTRWAENKSAADVAQQSANGFAFFPLLQYHHLTMKMFNS